MDIKNILPFLFILISLSSFSQKIKILNNESSYMSIPDKSGEIDFIVIDNKLDTIKPLFLWCQGSLPYPLYVNTQNRLWFLGGGIPNFDVQNIKKHYYIVVISMPKTPLVAEENQLNKSFWYYGNSGDENKPTSEFRKADYLENYTYRANKVIKYLLKQPWVNSKQVVVAGHSQGAHVALNVALTNKHVTRLGLFGFNVFGRIDQFIREARKQAESGEISWNKADSTMETYYEFYKNVNNADSTKKYSEQIPWGSFSKPQINDLTKIKIPIYLAYGTSDITSDLCDLVPLYFIRKHKNNLTYKRYFNVEHNFFEVENKKTNYDKPHWKEVMNNFVNWSIK